MKQKTDEQQRKSKGETWLFKKFNKFAKPPARLMKKGEENTNDIRNGKRK